MYDMADHKIGHRIGWEAGGGGVRFRCRAAVRKGAPLFNNYGEKGNQELLFTYGFAVRDSRLRSPRDRRPCAFRKLVITTLPPATICARRSALQFRSCARDRSKEG